MSQTLVMAQEPQQSQQNPIRRLSSAERVALENHLRTRLNSLEQRFSYAYVYFGGTSKKALEFCGNPKPFVVNKLLANEVVQEYIDVLLLKKELADAEIFKKENAILDYPKKVEMLWRIAINNEHIDPRLSIASIMELNRMQGHTIFNAQAQEKSAPMPSLLKAVVDKAQEDIQKVKEY